MFNELTGYPHDSNTVQSALRLQLRQARLAKKKPTWLCPVLSAPEVINVIHVTISSVPKVLLR